MKAMYHHGFFSFALTAATLLGQVSFGFCFQVEPTFFVPKYENC
jgi:hypothetical protein